MTSIDKIIAKLEEKKKLKLLKEKQIEQELIDQLNNQNDYLKYWDRVYENISSLSNATSAGGGKYIKQSSSSIFKINVTVSNETVSLPLESGYLYDFIVDWGDGSPLTNVLSFDDVNTTHIYTTGSYDISIDGKCQSFNVNSGSFKLFINEVKQWSTTSDFLKLNFAGCSNLTTLPPGSITGADNITNFKSTFRGCSISSIPDNLFDNNRLVSTEGFHLTFYSCVLLNVIPDNLFDNNILVSTYGFYCTFKGCISLETAPANLFRNNVEVSTEGFNSTFFGCNKLKLNRNIFYADGEQSTRFLNQISNFSGCFNRDTFTGSQGESPDLWNCDFGTETPVITNVFDGVGNSLISISNYSDIPIEWK